MRPATGEKPGAQMRVRHSCLRPVSLPASGTRQGPTSLPVFDSLCPRSASLPAPESAPKQARLHGTCSASVPHPHGAPEINGESARRTARLYRHHEPRIGGDSGHIPPFRASEAAERPNGPGLSRTQGPAPRLTRSQEEPGHTGFKVYQFRLPQPGKTPTRRTERPRPGESSPSPAFPKTPPEGRSPRLSAANTTKTQTDARQRAKKTAFKKAGRRGTSALSSAKEKGPPA